MLNLWNMKISYKEFYEFVKNKSPWLCSVWNEYNNSKDPEIGDLYLVKNEVKCVKCEFIKVLFDNDFKGGVAFWYVFKSLDDNREIRIHSINAVYDDYNLTSEERNDVFKFWIDCKPIKK